jgi:hypothetical protein
VLGTLAQGTPHCAHLADIDVLITRWGNKELGPVGRIRHLVVKEALQTGARRAIREGEVILREGCLVGGARRSGGTRPRLA